MIKETFMKRDKIMLIVTTTAIVLILFFLLDRESMGRRLTIGKINPSVNSRAEIKSDEYKVSSEAPDFTLETLDGDIVSLSDYKDKVVFINFFVTWSDENESEIKNFDKLQENFEDVEVLCINVREDYRVVKEFRETHKIDSTILLDKDGEIGLDYLVGKLPTTYIVNREGRLVNRICEAMDYETMAYELEKNL